MKQLLSIFIAVLVAITAFGQSSPPNKLRSNDSFTQVDNYLVAAKRLGIPSGPSLTLDGSTSSADAPKLFWRTSDSTLHVYVPALSSWLPAGGSTGPVVVPDLQAVTDQGNSTTNNINTSAAVQANAFNGVNATLSGALQTNTATVSGVLSGSTGTFSGLVSAPTAPTADAHLANKQYVDANSPIEAVDNAGVNGYRLRGNTTVVGQDAFDFSRNTKSGNGATGNGAIILGGTKTNTTSNIIASGSNSIIIGGNAASSATISAIGSGSINIGSTTSSSGQSIVEGSGISIGVRAGNTIVNNSSATLVGVQQSGTGLNNTFNSSNGIFNSSLSNTVYNANLRRVTIVGAALSRGTLNLGTGTNADSEANPNILGGYYSSGTSGHATNINATGRGSVIIGGHEVTASGNTTIDKTIYGYGSVLLGGTGLQSYGYGSVTMGVYNDPIPTTRRTAFNATDPIFIIGNGTSNTNRSNSYLIYGNGKSEQIGDVEVTTVGQGIILKSPDGNRWRITVDNSGNLTTTAL